MKTIEEKREEMARCCFITEFCDCCQLKSNAEVKCNRNGNHVAWLLPDGATDEEVITAHKLVCAQEEQTKEDVAISILETTTEKPKAEERIVYISGTIGTDGKEIDACWTEQKLKIKGFKTINPARLLKEFNFMPLQGIKELSLELMDYADIICLGENWKDTEITKAEIKRAFENNLEIIRE